MNKLVFLLLTQLLVLPLYFLLSFPSHLKMNPSIFSEI